MPRLPLNYLPKLVGYTLPVVIKAIDELGAPSEIRQVASESKQGPLLVTLAAQLAIIVADAIYYELARTADHTRHSDLFAFHGGARYRSLLRDLRLAHQQRTRAFAGVFQLERRLTQQSSATFELGTWPQGEKVQSPLAGVLTWNPGWRDKSATAAKRCYQQAIASFLALNKKCDKLVKRVEAEEPRIQNLPPFVREVAALRQKPGESYVYRSKGNPARRSTRFHISESTSLLEDGAGFYLRCTEPRWWRLFTERVEQQVSLDYAGTAHRLMLRDPLLHNAIEVLLNATKGGRKLHSVEGATQTVLTTPGDYNPKLGWPGLSISGDVARQTRTTLGKQDKGAMQWINARSGERHPLDPYRSFRFRLAQGKQAQMRFTFQKGYDVCRAENELLWCLSRRDPEAYPFRGVFPDGKERKAWEERVRKTGDRTFGYYSYPKAAKVI